MAVADGAEAARNGKATRLDIEAGVRLVRVARRRDVAFMVAGIVVLFISMGLLITLLMDLAYDGAGRIDREFLTNYPSRRPE
ncbi:MAG TPA: hypothetical protein VHG92_12135, partial [Afifellaceae bacterium]|nr:hypothetical protein [Afifellaceae bacterium]